MIEKGPKKGTVKFTFKANNVVKDAYVAGDFTNWQPQKMRRQKDNSFVVVLPAGKGEHQYKFVVDDQWLVDPDNERRCVNSLGTLNSIAIVE